MISTKITRDDLFLLVVFFLAVAVGSFVWNMSQNIVIEGSFVIQPANNGVKRPAIKVTEPKVLSTIVSPVAITGSASGRWFFEGSVPIKILDENENVLGSGVGTALSKTNTKSMVPFKASITFKKSPTKSGFIEVNQDDVLGDGNFATTRIPVSFSDSNEVEPISSKPCVISGCSAEICGEEEMMSTCEYKEIYACYKKTKCERQASGRCGWTETKELQMCLDAAN